MPSIRGLLGSCSDIGDVAARTGFRDGYTGSLLAWQQIGKEFLVQSLASEFDYGGDA